MSTDCSVIAKAGNVYYSWGYIKWDGYPDGKGQELKSIIEGYETIEEMIEHIDNIADGYCRRVENYSINQAYTNANNCNDYMYYLDLDSKKIYIVDDECKQPDYNLGWSEYVEYKRTHSTYTPIEFDEYVKMTTILSDFEDGCSEAPTKKDLLNYLKKFNLTEDQTILYTNKYSDCYGFNESTIMETE